MSLMPILRHSRRNHFDDPISVWDEHLIRTPRVRQNVQMNIWDPSLHFDVDDDRIICTPHVRQDGVTAAPFGGATFEWWETPGAHVLRAKIPGFGKGEVRVEVGEGDVLRIIGERGREREEKNEHCYEFESIKGRFVKALSLPENCWPDKIRFSLENGVVVVTVPKRDV